HDRISEPATTRVAREHSSPAPARHITRPPLATPHAVTLVPFESFDTAVPKPSPPWIWFHAFGRSERYDSVWLTRNRVPLSCNPVNTICAVPNTGSPDPTEYGNTVSSPVLASNQPTSAPRAAAN